MAKPLTLSFEVMGTQEISRGFSRFADKVKDLSDAFREIVKDFHEGERRQFETGGGYGAGGWKPLAPSTVAFKSRYGLPSQVLVRTGLLRESLIGENPWSIAEVRKLEAIMGTKLTYGRYHQTGTEQMPDRPVIMLPEEQKTRWTKIIHKHLVQQLDRSF